MILLNYSVCFRCAKGYRVVTQSDSISCQSDGTWSKQSVRCEPIPCSFPSNLTHVVISGAQFTPVGGIVSISCMPGFYLEGPGLSECEVHPNGVDIAFISVMTEAL